MKKISFILILFISSLLSAQDFKTTAINQHRFMDWQNAVPVATSAAAISMDMLTTQRFFAYRDFYETNSIASLYGKSRAGSIAVGFTALGAEVGGMYLAHRLERHHSRIWGIVERSIPVVVTAVEFRYAHANMKAINYYKSH